MGRYMEQHFEILGISQAATLEEIRKQYWALAKKYHPDCNDGDPGAGETFKKISDAYYRIRMVREGKAPTTPAAPSRHHGFDPVSFWWNMTMWQLRFWSWPSAATARS